MSKVFFKPWIGKDYPEGGIFGKRILALGEAHLCGGCPECGREFAEECEDMRTPDIVRFYLDNHRGVWSRTFRKFERVLSGGCTDNDDSMRIWESIAFYNYVQVALSAARTSPTDEDYAAAEEPFFEVINELRPDLIIAWGKTRLYGGMTGRYWEPGEYISVDGLVAPTGFYTLTDGTKVKIVWISHPSSGFSPEKWHNVIKTVL